MLTTAKGSSNVTLEGYERGTGAVALRGLALRAEHLTVTGHESIKVAFDIGREAK